VFGSANQSELRCRLANCRCCNLQLQVAVCNVVWTLVVTCEVYIFSSVVHFKSIQLVSRGL
jgi:hypothetical protein